MRRIENKFKFLACHVSKLFKENFVQVCQGKRCCFRPDNQELQEAFDTVYEVQLLEINLLVLFLMFAENIDVVFF